MWLRQSVFLAASMLMVGATPVTSQDVLVSSNGYGSLGFAKSSQRFTRFLQHPYKYESEGVATRNLLFDAYFGVRVAGQGAWLPEQTPCEPAYEVGTGIISCTQTLFGLRLTTIGYAPRDIAGPAYVVGLVVENTSGSSVTADVYSLLNHRLSDARPIPEASGEYVEWKQGAFVEYGPYQRSAAAVVYVPLGDPIRRTFDGAGAGENPYSLVKDARDFPALIDAPEGGRNADDIALGFQWGMTLAAGAKRSLGVVVSVDHGNQFDAARGRINDYLAAKAAGASDFEALLTNERARWAKLIPAAPTKLSAEEARVYRQAAATLLMAQVHESGRAQGQILAALAPATSADADQWNITWVRDMTYAIVALCELGYFAEARAALAFMLLADSGKYIDYVGRPYQISITRYFGNGTEETDFNADGPNIEFDGFGSMLWALGRYTSLSKDESLAKDYWPIIKPLVADALVSVIEPYTQLVKADSSIWEVHWNGKQKQYAYTTITAIAGLCSVGDIATELGDAALGREYRNVARRMRQSVLDNMFDSAGVLAQSFQDLQAGKGYLDGAVADAWALGVLDPADARTQTTLSALKTGLAIGDGRGIRRNDDGGEYDNREWVFVDLRLSQALRRSGRVAEANAIVEWITAQAGANYQVIAELYDEALSGPNAAVHRGASPMVGFGAGAYVLAVNEKYGLSQAWAACGSFANEAETSAGQLPKIEEPKAPVAAEAPRAIARAKGGCNASGPGDSSFWVALLVAFLATVHVVRKRGPWGDSLP